MISRNFILGKLTPYSGKKELIIDDQETKDIINEILRSHKEFQKDYDKICLYFWKGNIKSTARFLFNFLKGNVKYSIESDQRQSVKSPAGILATGIYHNGGNDCKHYSQFIAGILSALQRKGKNIDWCYRFANYRYFTRQPQHVFVVIKNRSGEIWVDPVLNEFDYKKAYVNKIDKKIDMPLYKISGVDSYNPFDVKDAFGQIDIGRVKRKPSKIKKIIKKGTSIVTKGVKKVTRGAKKIYIAVPRNSFLALVKLNVFNMAYHLNESLKNTNKRSKLLSKWYKLGGNQKSLLISIKAGIDKYKKKHPNYIGDAGVTEALIASATTIILALAEFVGKSAKEKAEKKAETSSPEEKQQIESVKQLANQTSTSSTSNSSKETSTKDQTDDQGEETSTETGFNKNYLIYGALGLGAVYLLTRKKK